MILWVVLHAAALVKKGVKNLLNLCYIIEILKFKSPNDSFQHLVIYQYFNGNILLYACTVFQLLI